MGITPLKAIKIECGVCRRSQDPCNSRHCSLKKSGSTLERIKAFCATCSPGRQTSNCTGKVIGAQARAYNSLYGISIKDDKAECPLYPFRYGKNPNLRRAQSAEQKKAFVERARQYRFEKKETLSPAERTE